jgi:hypothetical protein
MKPLDFFSHPQSVAQKQYEALRKNFVENVKANLVAKDFGIPIGVLQQ